MSFEPKTQAFNSSISSVTIGTGDKAVTLGGINVLPFYAFDAPITNAPKIGVEITDHGMAAYPQAGLQEFYAGCQTVADMAKRVETMHGASFICLHFEGADPNGDNRSVEECVEIAKSVADATDLPLVIMGCKNIEKDAELFTKVSEALQEMCIRDSHSPASSRCGSWRLNRNCRNVCSLPSRQRAKFDRCAQSMAGKISASAIVLRQSPVRSR